MDAHPLFQPDTLLLDPEAWRIAKVVHAFDALPDNTRKQLQTLRRKAWNCKVQRSKYYARRKEYEEALQLTDRLTEQRNTLLALRQTLRHQLVDVMQTVLLDCYDAEEMPSEDARVPQAALSLLIVALAHTPLPARERFKAAVHTALTAHYFGDVN